MRAKVIQTEISKKGVIHIEDHELPPGKVDIVVLLRDPKPVYKRNEKSKHLPLGGYKSGLLSPEQLRREAIYEEL